MKDLRRRFGVIHHCICGMYRITERRTVTPYLTKFVTRHFLSRPGRIDHKKVRQAVSLSHDHQSRNLMKIIVVATRDGQARQPVLLFSSQRRRWIWPVSEKYRGRRLSRAVLRTRARGAASFRVRFAAHCRYPQYLTVPRWGLPQR